MRGVCAENESQPHLIESVDGVLRRPGGTARCWPIDRMSTAVNPKTGDLLPGFAAVARYHRTSERYVRFAGWCDGSPTVRRLCALTWVDVFNS